MEKVDVTIIVICYNFEIFINKALESIKNQTVRPSQLIIIDDGSTDRSIKRINEWIKYNKNYLLNIDLLVKTKKNEGLVRTLNYIIPFAQCKYISLLSGDDYMNPFRVEKMVDYLDKNNSFDAVFSDYYTEKRLENDIVYSNTCIPKNFNNMNYTKKVKYILKHSGFWVGSNLYTKKLFGNIKFNEKYRNLEDIPFKLNIVKKYKIGIINEPLTIYVIRNNNMTIIRNKEILNDSLSILNDFKPYINKFNLSILKCMYISNYYKGIYEVTKNKFYLILYILLYPKRIKHLLQK